MEYKIKKLKNLPNMDKIQEFFKNKIHLNENSFDISYKFAAIP